MARLSFCAASDVPLLLSLPFPLLVCCSALDSLEREWGRQAREAARPSNGEFWWRLAVEKHTGDVGAFSQTIPWQALCKHSLAVYFLEVLGDEGRDRPLLVRKCTEGERGGVGHG